MKIAEILTVERVAVRPRVADKPAALRAMAELLEEAVPDLDAEAIAEVFAEREALASTGVGSGVAIPHGRYAGVPSLLASVMILHEGVDFESIDGRPVDIVVALLGPKNLDHLKALSRVSRVLRSEQVRERLRAARDAESAFAIFVESDR